MKVLYDHQIFESRFGGISRYFVELMRFNPTSLLSLKYSDNIYLSSDTIKKNNILPKDYEYDLFLPKINFKGKGRLFRFFSNVTQKNNLSLSINTLNEQDFDVFHPTYYDPYFLKYLKEKPFVLTVHDMIHELFPEYFYNDKATIANKKICINNADRINVNSETTKQDLLKIYPNVEDKVKITYLAFSNKILTAERKMGNYLLFTGSRDGYKNFVAFIQAIAPLLLRFDLNLICTGHDFNIKEINLFENLQIADKVICKLASDEELNKLYSEAIAFIFPSLYEGFGIPILEAFASGCPAILSNTSSLPEIGGEAAVYFDPYSIDDMRSAIEKVITSECLQKELIIKGKDRVKKFSWEKCATETMHVYDSLVAS
jgi:glycosyltransferase involved in cell wall biosynthesis